MPEYHQPIEIHGGGGLTENSVLRHLREAIILFIYAEERGFLFGGGVGGEQAAGRATHITNR